MLIGGFLIAVLRFSMVDPKHEDLVRAYVPILKTHMKMVGDQSDIPKEQHLDSDEQIGGVLHVLVMKIHSRYITSYAEPCLMLLGGILIAAGYRKKQT